MTEKTRNILKYISLVCLLVGVAIWAWYIIFIMILSKTPYGEILLTLPIGILGTVSGIISKNKKLIILNSIQTLAFPIVFFITIFLEVKNV